MSYILEALKRSQQEQALGRVPTLASPPPDATPAPSRAGPWIAAALVLAAAAVGIALYALLGRAPQPTLAHGDHAQGPERPVEAAVAGPSPAPPPPAREPVVAPIPAPSPPSDTPIRPAARHDRQAGSPARLAQPPLPPGIPPELVSEVRRFEQRVHGQIPTPVPESAPPPSPVAQPTTAPTPPPVQVPDWQRLDPALRGRIPPQSVSVHVYSEEPTQRFVVLNGRKVREGEHTRDGLTVVAIRRDGVVLEFEARRFLLPR